MIAANWFRSAVSCCAAVGAIALSAAEASAQRSFTIAHEPGNASRNGYAQAMTILNYWFESCGDGIFIVVQLQPNPSISREYWFSGRSVNAGVARVPPARGLNRNVSGSVVGGISREVSANATTSTNPGCHDGIRVGSSSELFPPNATDQQKESLLQSLGFSPHGIGNLPPFRNDDVESHYRGVLATEARPTEQPRVAEARPVAAAAQPSAATQRQAQGRQAFPQTAAAPSSGAVDRNEAIPRQNDAIAARNRAQSDSLLASMQAADARREADTRQVTEVAEAVGGVVGGILEARRAAGERRDQKEALRQARNAAILAERFANANADVATRQTPFRASAAAGDPEAQYRMGEAHSFASANYEFHRGESTRWYTLAANQGHAGAMWGLALHYFPGDSTREVNAVRLLTSALENAPNDPLFKAVAAYELGRIHDPNRVYPEQRYWKTYKIGRPYPRNRELAVRWYTLSVSNFNACANPCESPWVGNNRSVDPSMVRLRRDNGRDNALTALARLGVSVASGDGSASGRRWLSDEPNVPAPAGIIPPEIGPREESAVYVRIAMMVTNGVNATRNQQLRDGLGFFEQALASSPYHRDGLMNSSIVYHRLGDYHNMLARLRHLGAVEPENRDVWRLHSIAFSELAKTGSTVRGGATVAPAWSDSATKYLRLSDEFEHDALIVEFTVMKEWARVGGRITNRSFAPRTYRTRVEFLNSEGAVVGTSDVTLGPVDPNAHGFYTVDVKATNIVAFRYSPFF